MQTYIKSLLWALGGFFLDYCLVYFFLDVLHLSTEDEPVLLIRQGVHGEAMVWFLLMGEEYAYES